MSGNKNSDKKEKVTYLTKEVGMIKAADARMLAECYGLQGILTGIREEATNGRFGLTLCPHEVLESETIDSLRTLGYRVIRTKADPYIEYEIMW
jgi:hypothetical protein